MRIIVLLATLFFAFGVQAHDREPVAGTVQVHEDGKGRAPDVNVDDLLDFEKVEEEIERENQRKEEERIRQIREIFRNRTGQDVLDDEELKRVEIA